MNPTPTMVLLWGFALGLIFGVFPFLLTQRDFVSAYFSVRFGSGKRLLAVHSVDGTNIFWKVGFLKDGLWQYKHKKGDLRCFTIGDGVVKRTMGVNIINILELVTAPFNFKHVYADKVVSVPVLNAKGEMIAILDSKTKEHKKDASGMLLYEFKDQVEKIVFNAYFDSKTIIAALEAALAKKTSKSAMAFGNIDFRKLLIIAAVVVGGWYVIKNFVMTGQTPTI